MRKWKIHLFLQSSVVIFSVRKTAFKYKLQTKENSMINNQAIQGCGRQVRAKKIKTFLQVLSEMMRRKSERLKAS